MEVTGKIIAKLPQRSGTSKTGNEWHAQEYVLETQESYPKKVHFDFFGAKADEFAWIEIGQTIKLSFDIESREYNGKWYNSLNLWRIWESAEHSIPTQYPATPNPNDQPVLPPQTPAPQPPAAQAYATTAQQMAAPTAPSQPQQLPLTNEDCLPF